VEPVIARRGAEHGSGLSRQRWVVERSFAWLHDFRRLRIRYERRAGLHLAFMRLGCAAICRRAGLSSVEGVAEVLVGDRPPAPDRDRHRGHGAVLLHRVGLPGLHGEAVAPVVAEVEGVVESISGLDLLGHLQGRLVEPFIGVLGVEDADPAPIGELEAVQVGEVPAGEGQVDRLRQVTEGVRRADDDDAARRRLEVDAVTTQEVDLDPQPRPRRRAWSLWGFETASKARWSRKLPNER
jgi:Transposase DDE domain